MADFKGHMFRHLRSARIWLTRAEESFDKDSKIRGELDLFLAQAELQRARETSLSQPRRKHPLLRHAASFVFACALVAAGFGTYWGLSERQAAMPIPLAAQEAKVVPAAPRAPEPAAPVQVEDQRPAPPKVTTVSAPAPSAVQAQSQEKAERPRPAAKENLLSPDELQTVIRAAGKSLRGQ